MNRNIDGLIYKYRMMGFDKPKFLFNKHFNCLTLDITDCSGQWKAIKGNSEYACLIGAFKWIKANYNKIKNGRKYVELQYLKLKYEN